MNLRPLKNKNFACFFFAALLGVFGEGIFALASIVVILKNTNSVMFVSYLLILTMLPSVFLAPFSGVIIDKFNKAKISIICSLGRFILIGLVPLSILLNFHVIGIMLGVIFFSYILWYILLPTNESMLKELLRKDEYIEGVSLFQAAWQTGLLSSAILAGSLMEFVGIKQTILIASCTYLLSAILFLLIHSNYKTEHSNDNNQNMSISNYLLEIREGWGYIVENKHILYLTLAACIVQPFFSGINILIAPFNYEVLKGNQFSLGIIDSAAGIGSLLSAIFCLLVAKRKEIPILQIASIVLLGFSLLLFSSSGKFTLSFLLYILVGLFIGNTKVFSRSLIYQYVNQSYIGRTMSTISMISLGVAIFYSYIVGQLGEIRVEYGYFFIVFSLFAPLFFMLLFVINLKKKIQMNFQFQEADK